MTKQIKGIHNKIDQKHNHSYSSIYRSPPFSEPFKIRVSSPCGSPPTAGQPDRHTCSAIYFLRSMCEQCSQERRICLALQIPRSVPKISKKLVFVSDSSGGNGDYFRRHYLVKQKPDHNRKSDFGVIHCQLD